MPRLITKHSTANSRQRENHWYASETSGGHKFPEHTVRHKTFDWSTIRRRRGAKGPAECGLQDCEISKRRRLGRSSRQSVLSQPSGRFCSHENEGNCWLILFLIEYYMKV